MSIIIIKIAYADTRMPSIVLFVEKKECLHHNQVLTTMPVPTLVMQFNFGVQNFETPIKIKNKILFPYLQTLESKVMIFSLYLSEGLNKNQPVPYRNTVASLKYEAFQRKRYLFPK